MMKGGKIPYKTNVNKYPLIEAAQKMTHTDNGQEINCSFSFPMTRSGIEMIKKDPKISEEKRLVLMSPFSNMDRVSDQLYLTSLGGITIENIAKYKITCVINVTHDLPILNYKDVETYRIPVDDDIIEDLLMYFDEVSDKIEDVSQNGGRTAVHCTAGVSRSTTIVLAYMIKYQHMTMKDSFRMVRNIRPCVRPNIAFMGQLMTFEEKLRGYSTSKIIKFVYQNRLVRMPDFYETEYPDLYRIEIAKQTSFETS